VRFIADVLVENGVVDADPVADPDLVLTPKLVGHEGEGPLRDRGCTQRLLLSFLGGAGTTTTVEIWALDRATADGPPASRVFYLVAPAFVLTNQQLVEVAATVPAHGTFYIRQTAGTDDGVVKVAVQVG